MGPGGSRVSALRPEAGDQVSENNSQGGYGQHPQNSLDPYGQPGQYGSHGHYGQHDHYGPPGQLGQPAQPGQPASYPQQGHPPQGQLQQCGQDGAGHQHGCGAPGAPAGPGGPSGPDGSDDGGGRGRGLLLGGDGDADEALCSLGTSPSDTTLLTDDVRSTSNEEAPSSDIQVDEPTTESDVCGEVNVELTTGDETVFCTFYGASTDQGGTWTIDNGTVDISHLPCVGDATLTVNGTSTAQGSTATPPLRSSAVR